MLSKNSKDKNTDMYISTLKRYIEAMGGSLEIRAIFPDGQIKGLAF